MAQITIIYKSGKQITVETEGFTTTRNAQAELTGLSWTSINPLPLFVGLNEIESIWENAKP